MALCAINKARQRFKSSRIAVLTPCVDHPFFLTSQYMRFMNAFFTAQKMDVMIDVAACKWPVASGSEESGSSILRQGCDITGGSYLSVPKPEALLQYLTWVLLPDQETRGNLVLPHKTPVGSKAACFCHRTILDVGYVCSVCLSGECVRVFAFCRLTRILHAFFSFLFLQSNLLHLQVRPDSCLSCQLFSLAPPPSPSARSSNWVPWCLRLPRTTGRSDREATDAAAAAATAAARTDSQ